MIKYILLYFLSFSCFASQSTEQIVDYCKKKYLKEWGNEVVLICVEQEIQAQKELNNLIKK